jgi:hypothetical protein
MPAKGSRPLGTLPQIYAFFIVVSREASMDTRNPQAGDQMRRQLAKQHKQQEQEQQQKKVNRFGPAGRELPAKQDQTQHNPVTEAQQRGSFTSDQ